MQGGGGVFVPLRKMNVCVWGGGVRAFESTNPAQTFPEAERKQRKDKNNVKKQITHCPAELGQACVCFSKQSYIQPVLGPAWKLSASGCSLADSPPSTFAWVGGGVWGAGLLNNKDWKTSFLPLGVLGKPVPEVAAGMWPLTQMCRSVS